MAPPQAALSLPKLTCRRCGHSWVPRREDVRMCPKCGSVRWDEPRKK